MHRTPAAFMGIFAKEAKEQLSGVYHIALNEMPKAFKNAKETTSCYASGIIGGILKAKGQIDKIPPPEATMDAQFVNALQVK